uniref:Ovule protein n=1 Tax=Brugia timori TaxID=42155 RepID=A0A0R3QEM7_9BILA
LNAALPGNHASKSSFFAAALFSSPETMHTIRNGIPSALQKSSAFSTISSSILQLSSSYGEHMTNCSTFSN